MHILQEQNRERLDSIITRYPDKQAALLPALHIVQEQEGFISREMMQYIADYLDIPFGHVLGVVTFYSMFNDKPVGRHHIQICTNVSCHLLGAETLLGHLCERCGIRPGQTTGDGRITLNVVECLGSCGTAPMMQINDDYYENLPVDKIDSLLNSLK
jgi:NADH-quinone oxidoreductase subunit E